MYTIIYKFIIKEDETENLLKSWLDLTKLIYKYEGSLGSRMHKVSDSEYIAYAQWPSKEIYINAGSNLPTEADPIRMKMKAACESIETLYEMEVVEDFLQNKLFTE